MLFSLFFADLNSLKSDIQLECMPKFIFNQFKSVFDVYIYNNCIRNTI